MIDKLNKLKKFTNNWVNHITEEDIIYLADKTPHLSIDINTISEFIFCLTNKISSNVECLVCGKPVKFISSSRGYSTFCSTKCRFTDKGKEHSNKVKENTNIKRYGVKYATQTKNVRDKIEKTNLEKYGFTVASQSKSVSEKISSSKKGKTRGKTYKRLLKENGGKHPICPVCGKEVDFNSGKSKFYVFCSSECRLSKEGKHYSQKVREKTNLKKYKTPFTATSEEVSNKRARTNIAKYGVDNPFKSPEIKEKLSKIRRENFWDRFLVLLENKKIKPRYSKEDYINKDTSKGYTCLLCNSLFDSSGEHPQNIYCDCHQNRSLKEEEVAEWVESLGVRIIRNYKEGKKEIDVYLPDYSLGIEFNGLYWHSTIFKDKNFHQEKYQFFKSKNIELVQIFENEWEYSRDIVKSLIRNRIGKITRKVFARKCIIKKVETNEYKDFLENNHIQGYAPAKVKLGLYYKGELVQVVSFSKSRYNKSYDWENIRTCSKLNTTVIGGFSKLLKYFGEDNIISYIDLRYFNGNSYLNNGFSEKGISSPNYFYFKDNSLILESRIKYQKHKLKDLLEDFNPIKTEMENMVQNNFRIIYDAGNLIVTTKEP